MWRVGSPSSVWSLAGNSAAVECVCFDEEETTVASGSRGGAVKVCSLLAFFLALSLSLKRIVGAWKWCTYLLCLDCQNARSIAHKAVNSIG